MDVVSSAQAAAELAGLFLQIVQATKHVIETMKGAGAALVEMYTRAEHIRRNLELFRSLTNRLSDPMEKITALSFNDSAYRQTATEVLSLVRKVADSGKRHDLLMKFNWLYYRSDMTALVKKLEEREKDLGLVLTFIAAQSSVITESEVLRLRTKTEERTKVIDTFMNMHEGKDTQNTQDSETSGSGRAISNDIVFDERPRAGWPDVPVLRQSSPTLWLGTLVRQSFSPTYLERRDELSEAAYSGDWETVLESIDEGKKSFKEAWPNAVRLGSTNNYSELSLWTPLHQAAYMRAPVSYISKLIEHGAFRTLPTGQTRGEFQFPDLTASEIAQALGYDDIYDVLAPVIKHHLPATTLVFLQAKFHEFLRVELEIEEGGSLLSKGIRLPLLAPFTELERPEMWFPLPSLRKGFLCRLDGRELVVLSLGRGKSPSKQVFRITTEGWTAIHDTVIVD